MGEVRTAVGAYAHKSLDQIESYLPANYQAVRVDDITVAIVGKDDAGWTLDDYVLPRLASGLWFFREVGK